MQGVGYRFALATVASQHGLTGWVRNRRDGTVETELEGPGAAVEAVSAWLADGPPAARVTAVRREQIVPTGAPGFDIRPDA